MKCPQCEEVGERSKVFVEGRSSTAMGGTGPYWDEDGEYHNHDPNLVTTAYRCSNGHTWGTRKRTECPNENCDYGKE